LPVDALKPPEALEPTLVHLERKLACEAGGEELHQAYPCRLLPKLHRLVDVLAQPVTQLWGDLLILHVPVEVCDIDPEPGHVGRDGRGKRAEGANDVREAEDAAIRSEFAAADARVLQEAKDWAEEKVSEEAQLRSDEDAEIRYEFAAADAYPLLNSANSDWQEFSSRIICGKDTITPRSVPLPIRMPLPPAINQGSIYENQTAGKRYFGFVEQGGKKNATA
jgi:hypothetical protein